MKSAEIKAQRQAWVTSTEHVPRTHALSQFEVLTTGIPEADWAPSKAVTTWVRKHASTRYVPESLLRQLGITPTIQ